MWSFTEITPVNPSSLFFCVFACVSVCVYEVILARWLIHELGLLMPQINKSFCILIFILHSAMSLYLEVYVVPHFQIPAPLLNYSEYYTGKED